MDRFVKQVTFAKLARKTFYSLPVPDQNHIRSKIDQYAADPASLANNVKALKGSPYVRLRVGDWRVIMDDGSLILEIVRIGARGGVYD